MVKIEAPEERKPAVPQRAPYTNLHSKTWWAGFALIVAGGLKALEPTAMQPVVELINQYTDLDALELVLFGTAVIGGRRKLEDLDLKARS